MPRPRPSVVSNTYGLIAAILAAVLVAAVPARAAPAAYAVGDATIRFDPPPGVCVLDSAAPLQDRMLQATAAAFDDTTTVFAVIALCDSLARGRTEGWTALFVHDDEREVSPALHLFKEIGWFSEHEIPAYATRALLLADAQTLAAPSRDGWVNTVAVYMNGPVIIEAGEVLEDNSRHLRLTGQTSVAGMVVRLTTFTHIDTAAQLDKFMSLQEALIDSLRALNPT